MQIGVVLVFIGYYFGLWLWPIVISVSVLGGVELCRRRFQKGPEVQIAHRVPTTPGPEQPPIGCASDLKIAGLVRLTEVALNALVWTFPVFVMAVQWARYLRGGQGIDFAIFTQVAERFAQTGVLESSLVGTRWTPYLAHHFSPVLALVGLLARVIGNTPFTFILVQALGVLATMLALRKLMRTLGWSRTQQLLGLSLFVLLPAPRIALLWEVHDEVLAMPLIVLAFEACLRGKFGAMYALLAFCAGFKETMFVLFSAFALLAYLRPLLDRETPSNEVITRLTRRDAVVHLGFAGVGIFAFLLYTKILPHWTFNPTFDASTRVASIRSFFSESVLIEKGLLTASIVFGLLPLLLAVQRAGRLKDLLWGLLCGAPFLGAILLTDFEPTFYRYTYYSVLPTLTCFLALVGATRTRPPSALCLFASILFATLLGPRQDTTRDLLDAWQLGNRAVPLARVISTSDAVIADAWDLPYFIEQRQVTALFYARRLHARFDKLVLRKGMPQSVPRYLRAWSTVCFENEDWIVRCAHPKFRPLKNGSGSPFESSSLS